MKTGWHLTAFCAAAVFPMALLARNDHPAHANCQQSSSWQCSGVTGSTSGQTMTGTSPGVAGTHPPANTGGTPIGGVPTDVHQSTLVPLPGKGGKGDKGGAPKLKPPLSQTAPPTAAVPPMPPPQKTPQPMAVVEPPRILPEQKIPTPMPTPLLVPAQPVPYAVPPMPLPQKTPQPMAVVEPPRILPEQKIPTPMVAPIWILKDKQHKAEDLHQKPVVRPQPLPHQPVPAVLMTHGEGHDGRPTPQAHPSVQGDAEHTHAIVHHDPLPVHPVHVGDHMGSVPYTLEFIEPGIQNQRVEVYRSQDAKQMIYKDTIPLDQGVFQLIVIGTRNPPYVH